MLKTFVDGIKPIWQALTGVHADELSKIRAVCDDYRRSMWSLIETDNSCVPLTTIEKSKNSSKQPSMTM